MSIRDTIARWLSPDLVKAEAERDWLLVEIEHEHRWLSEFRPVERTLDRIKKEFEWQFRKGPGPLPSTITAFREELRRHEASRPL